MDHMEGAGEVPIDPFFLQEGSLKLLCRYLRKLSQWHHDTIYLFYLQLLNLYYWYDTKATHEEIVKQLTDKIDFSGSVPSSKLFCKDF
jgi:hypothetical protein